MIKDLYFFKNLAAGQRFSVMEPHIGPISTYKVTGIVVALTNTLTQFNGLVGATFPVEVFLARWQEILRKQSSFSAMVTDGNGKPFFASGPFFPKGMDTVEQLRYGDLKNLQRDLRLSDGLKYAHYSRQSPLSNWTVHLISPSNIQFFTYLVKHLEIVAVGVLLLLMLFSTVLLIAKDARDSRILQENEERFRQLAENIGSVFWISPIDKKSVLYVSPAFETIWGVSPQQLYERPMLWLESIHPEDRERIFQSATNKQELGTYDEEYRIIQPSGEIRWISDRAFPLRDSRGIIYRLVGIATDITKRRKNETARLKSEGITQALYKITNAIGSTRDMDELYGSIHQILSEHLDATNFYIAMVDEDRNCLEFPIFTDEQDSHSGLQNISDLEVKSLTLEVIRSRKSLLVGDVDIEGVVPLQRFGQENVVGSVPAIWMGVPLTVGGQVIGAMVVQHYTDPHKYGPEDKVWLSNIAEQVAMAIDRKQTLEALQASEASLSSIFRAVPTGIGVIQDRVLVTVNDRFCEIFGYERKELLGQGTRNLYMCEDEFNRCGKEIYGQLEKHEVSSVEAHMVRKDGCEIFVLINSSMLVLGEGTMKITSALLDITERKLALKALEANEDYLSSIFRAAPIGIGVLENRVIVTANDRFCQLLGYEREEIIGQSTKKLYVSEEEYQRCGSEIYGSLKASGTCSVEAHVLRKDGRKVQLLLNAALLNSAGKEQAVTFSILDITDRKQIDEKLKRSQLELEATVCKRTEELSGTVEVLKRRNLESETLSKLGDLLQSCETEEESYTIVTSLCEQVFLCHSGFLAIYDRELDAMLTVAVFGGYIADSSELRPNDCWALRRGGTHLVVDPLVDPICLHSRGKQRLSSLCVPIGAKGESIGLLHLLWELKTDSEKQCDREVEVVTGLAKRVAELYGLSLSNIQLRTRLRQQSIRDRLTGLYNRRHMEESLRREIARAKRKKTRVGVILLDVDHFKKFNDTYGHDAGDEVLRKLGEYLNRLTREEDIACRYGGEEFIVIMNDCTTEGAAIRGEGIRAGIESLAINYGGTQLNVTASIGVASYPDHGDNSQTVIITADAALYKAKKAGRNRVVVIPLVSTSKVHLEVEPVINVIP